MTKEHAYPNWVLNLLPGDKAGTTFYLSSKLPEFLRAWWKQGETGVTVKPVCKECNEGWMSRLEVQSRAILGPLMLDAERDFTNEEKAAIVAWTLKTWMVFDAASRKQHRMLFSPDERKYLMETRRPHPSLNAVVFLARYVGRREMNADGYRFAISTHPEPESAGTNIDRLNRFHCETFVFGRLAIQATVRRIVTDDTDFPGIDRSWLDAQLDITWTHGGDHWPPKVTLDEQGYLEFRDRWLPDDLRKKRRELSVREPPMKDV